MSDILFFTLDDLGHRQAYVIAIFAIVLLAIAAVLLRDVWAWFEALGEQAGESHDEELDAALETDIEVEAEQARPSLQDRPAKAAAFIHTAPPAFGRRHREAA